MNTSALNCRFCFIIQFNYGRRANVVTWRVPRVWYAPCLTRKEMGGGGGKPRKSPNTKCCKYIDSRSTKSWYPRLSVDTSLPTHIFHKHSTFLGVGAHMVWGREAGGLMWIVEYLTKNSAAGPLICHQISVLLYCINVSLCERESHIPLFVNASDTCNPYPQYISI